MTVKAAKKEVSESVTLTLPPVAHRLLRAVLRCASSDATRPLLTCVELTASGGRVEAAATDSYRLGVARFPAPDCADGTLLLPGGLLRDALRSTSEKKLNVGAGQIVATGSAEAISVGVPGGLFTGGPFATPPDVHFPDWRSLVPTGECEYAAGKLAWSGPFLSVLGDIVLSVDPSGEVPVLPYLYGLRRLTRFVVATTHSKIEFTYMLMPVQVS